MTEKETANFSQVTPTAQEEMKEIKLKKAGKTDTKTTGKKDNYNNLGLDFTPDERYKEIQFKLFMSLQDFAMLSNELCLNQS